MSVFYTPLRTHETVPDLVCRLLLKKKTLHHVTANNDNYVPRVFKLHDHLFLLLIARHRICEGEGSWAASDVSLCLSLFVSLALSLSLSVCVCVCVVCVCVHTRA